MSISRLAPLSGLLGPVFVVIGLFTMVAPPAGGTDAQVAQWFAANGPGPWFLSALEVAIGGLFMLVFAAVLAARQEQQGAGPIGRHLTQIAATAWGLLTLVGAAVYATPPDTELFMAPQAPSADVYRSFSGLFYGTLVVFCALAAALLAFTLSVTSLRTGLLPRWVAWLGIPMSVLMLVNAFLPMALITLWFGIASVSLVVRPAGRLAIRAPELATSALV